MKWQCFFFVRSVRYEWIPTPGCVRAYTAALSRIHVIAVHSCNTAIVSDGGALLQYMFHPMAVCSCNIALSMLVAAVRSCDTVYSIIARQCCALLCYIFHPTAVRSCDTALFIFNLKVVGFVFRQVVDLLRKQQVFTEYLDNHTRLRSGVQSKRWILVEDRKPYPGSQ